jgi:hypothetical protein
MTVGKAVARMWSRKIKGRTAVARAEVSFVEGRSGRTTVDGNPAPASFTLEIRWKEAASNANRNL